MLISLHWQGLTEFLSNDMKKKNLGIIGIPFTCRDNSDLIQNSVFPMNLS